MLACCLLSTMRRLTHGVDPQKASHTGGELSCLGLWTGLVTAGELVGYGPPSAGNKTEAHTGADGQRWGTRRSAILPTPLPTYHHRESITGASLTHPSQAPASTLGSWSNLAAVYCTGPDLDTCIHHSPSIEKWDLYWASADTIRHCHHGGPPPARN